MVEVLVGAVPSSVWGYTNRGVCFPLTCARMTSHRPSKITTFKTGPNTRDQLFEGSECRSRRPRQAKGARYHEGKTSFAGQASLARSRLPRKQAPRSPRQAFWELRKQTTPA